MGQYTAGGRGEAGRNSGKFKINNKFVMNEEKMKKEDVGRRVNIMAINVE